jgi:hypothetical protein
MSSVHVIPADLLGHPHGTGLYEVHEWRNAAAILQEVYLEAWRDVIEVLRAFRLPRSDILTPGGGKSPIASKLDSAFYARGWEEKRFETRITVDQTSYDSPTHQVDCLKSKVALEVEWSNKDTFFDRDLNNFRLLFDLRAIDVGIIITRSDELQALFNELGKGKSYGQSTTHMSRLLPRLEGGGGGGCPVLAFGINRKLYVDDSLGTESAGPTVGPADENPQL